MITVKLQGDRKMSSDWGRPVLERGRLYNLLDVAAILGMHVSSVRRWVREGVLPAKRIGRLYFVDGGDLVPDRTLTKTENVVQ